MRVYLCTTCNKTVPLKELGEHRKRCATELELEGYDGSPSHFGRIALILVVIAMAVTGITLGFDSFSSVQSMRQLERIPATKIHAVLPGEANLSGMAIKQTDVLSAPKSGKKCFYYRYLVEREFRDSDGDRSWRTIKDQIRATNFILKDETGKIPIVISAGVDFSVPRSFQKQSGKERHTEWRVDAGDAVFLSGSVVDQQGQYGMHFNAPGDYDPIISKYDVESELFDMAGVSLLKCWASLVLLAFAIAFIVRASGANRLLTFLGVFCTVIFINLFIQGLIMMIGDLDAGADRLTHHKNAAKGLITNELRETKIPWDGDWQTLKAFSTYPKISATTASRLQRIRLDLAVATDRLQAQRAIYPANIVATLAGVTRHVDIPIPDSDQPEFTELLDAHREGKVQTDLAMAIIAAAIIVGLLSFRFGFRIIRNKRCLENVPTSRTTDAVLGPAEFKGIIGPPRNKLPLISPLTRSPCIYYHYVVKEKHGSDNDPSWRTIINESDRCGCTCIDGKGVIDVDPTDAEIMTRHETTRYLGDCMFWEIRLEIHDPLYIIGECGIHPDHADRLYVRKPEGNVPFILSNGTEKAVTKSVAGTGIVLLNLTFASILLIGLTTLGVFGSFGAEDYLAAAMLTPIFMLYMTLVLHHNDLVSLRERVNQNASKIDVSLKKRSDLLPNLEQIIKSYMSHEPEVMQAITKMRKAYARQNKNNPDSIGRYVMAEHEAVSCIIARMEAYPELNANGEARTVMRSIVSLKSEIALMREGYNHAVETYNTRIEILPSMLVAKTCGFKERKYIEIETREFTSRSRASHSSDVASAQSLSRRLAASLLDPLSADQLEASAAIYASLLNPTVEIRDSQIATIQEHHDEAMVEQTKLHVASIDSSPPNDVDRLKHAESQFKFILELTNSQYEIFNTVIRELAEADDEISLYEYAMQHAIIARLDSPRGQSPTVCVRHKTMKLLARQISMVLSVLARKSDDASKKTRPRAFRKSLRALECDGKIRISVLSDDAYNLPAFEAALDDLRRSKTPIRVAVQQACHTLVPYKADFTHEQVLLLIIIADALNLERPDWI